MKTNHTRDGSIGNDEHEVPHVPKTDLTKQDKAHEGKIQHPETLDYGKISFAIIIILVTLWLLSHIEFLPSVTIKYYNCPGVGLQTDIHNLLGCNEAFTKQINFVFYLK